MDQNKLRGILSNHALFREMAPEEIERIAQAAHEVRLNRGEIAFQRGDPCIGFYLVVYGQIKLAFSSPQGSEKIIELVSPGQSFGEAVMFLDRPYPVYAQALVDTLLLFVSKDAVFSELDRDPQFCRKMLAGLSLRLHGLVRDVEAYSLRSSSQRVIGYLLQHEDGGADAGGELRVHLPASKSAIASRLNLTPETFSRVLHELSTDKLIAVEAREIRILDIEKLRDYR